MMIPLPDQLPRHDSALSDVENFDRLSDHWWNEDFGPFRALHALNPLRMRRIKIWLATRFSRDPDDPLALRGLRILDLGCGGGIASEPICRLGASVTAVDASPRAIEIARSHAQAQGLKINYECRTFEEVFRIRDRVEFLNFDAVIALEVLEHLPDRVSFLRGAERVVDSRGLVIISTLSRSVRSFLLAIVGAEHVLRWLPDGTHDWRRFVTARELECEFERCGFRNYFAEGMVYNPISGRWTTSCDVAVNYIARAEPGGEMIG